MASGDGISHAQRVTEGVWPELWQKVRSSQKSSHCVCNGAVSLFGWTILV